MLTVMSALAQDIIKFELNERRISNCSQMSFLLQLLLCATKAQLPTLESFWTDSLLTNPQPPAADVRWPRQKVLMSNLQHLQLTYNQITKVVIIIYEYSQKGLSSSSTALFPGISWFPLLNQLPWTLKNLHTDMTLVIVCFWIQVSKWKKKKSK